MRTLEIIEGGKGRPHGDPRPGTDPEDWRALEFREAALRRDRETLEADRARHELTTQLWSVWLAVLFLVELVVLAYLVIRP